MQWQPIPLSKEEQEWLEMFNKVRMQAINAFNLPAEMIQPTKQQEDKRVHSPTGQRNSMKWEEEV